MEQPYKGRAIINDNVVNLEIIIPVKKNWFTILFTGAWLGIWVVSELSVAGMLVARLPKVADAFMIFWLTGWTIGGLFVFRVFLWNISGREIITIGQGTLTIKRK